MRRTLLVGLLATATLVLGACGDDDDSPDTTPTPGEPAGIELLQSSLARVAAEPSQAESAAQSLNQFAFDLYRQVRAEEDGNVVFSPYSVATALAMTRNGAAGQTLDEMTSVLYAGDDYDLSMNALDQAFTGRAGDYEVGENTVTVEIETANQLWGQREFPFETTFLDVIAQNFGAGLRIVDFIGDTEGSRQAINQWVSDRTRDRIPELIPEGIITVDTRLVLTNAVYLKAPWMWPFDEDGTEKGDFTLLDGSAIQADLMHVIAQVPYTEGDGFRAVELPYADGSLAMLVVVPDEGSFEDVSSAFDATMLDAVAGELQTAQVTLRLPKWEFRTQASLKDALSEMGMPTAFEGGIADFTRMSSAGDQLYISAVVHEAFIAVDEEGTEAAAATAVIIGETSAPEAVELTVDRPFMFFLRDRETGATIFIGQVTNPAADS